MNNELYIIKKEDYIKHIREKLQLYTIIKTLTKEINMIHPNRKSKKLSEIAEHYDKLCTKLYRAWGLPDGYVITEDEKLLIEYLENDLITPEDAGYVPSEELNKKAAGRTPDNLISEISNDCMNTIKELFNGCVDIHIHIE